MMTEEQAHVNAEALSIAMGITFYIVRSSEGDFLAVQTPGEQEIVATIEPPSEPKHKLE